MRLTPHFIDSHKGSRQRVAFAYYCYYWVIDLTTLLLLLYLQYAGRCYLRDTFLLSTTTE